MNCLVIQWQKCARFRIYVPLSHPYVFKKSPAKFVTEITRAQVFEKTGKVSLFLVNNRYFGMINCFYKKPMYNFNRKISQTYEITYFISIRRV